MTEYRSGWKNILAAATWIVPVEYDQYRQVVHLQRDLGFAV